MNPHVRWDRPGASQVSSDPNGISADPQIEKTTLPEAIAYAQSAQDAYRKAVGDQALLANVLPIPLIALAGIGIGYGIAQTMSAANVVLGTSLAGASGLAAGYWYSSPPRQRVYIMGIKAMTCAVIAVEPLHIDMQRIRGELDDLNNASSDVTKSAAEVNRAIAQLLATSGGDTPLIIEGQEAVRTALMKIEPADNAFAAGVKLELAVDRASPSLVNAVDRISTLVDEAILSTQPNLAQLPGIINGLAAGAAQFVKLPDEGTFPLVERKKPEVEGDVSSMARLQANEAQVARLKELELALSTAITTLGGKVAEIESAARRVAALVDAVNHKESFEALKNCGVEIEAPATALKIQPSGTIEFAEKKAGSRGFTILGGEHPYFTTLLDEVEGLSVRHEFGGGRSVKVSVTDKVPANTYNLQISDVKSNSLIVPITVVAAAAAGSGTDSQRTGAAGDQQVKDMQDALRAIGFDPGASDGKRGDETDQAIAAFLAAIQVDGDAATISVTDVGDLLVSNTQGIDTSVRNPNGVRDTAIENLLKELGHDPGNVNDIFTAETTAAVTAASGGTAMSEATVDDKKAILKMLRGKEAAAADDGS